ncbi:MAG TPA: endolytic transglycosylase MltG [Candidatus Micrarchaeia archaeon]|nr:endolytic transglycosylase MltG [Candidatus Micrarchaeia archaeon]
MTRPRLAACTLLLGLVAAVAVVGLVARGDLEPVQPTHRHRVVLAVRPGEGLDAVTAALGRDRLVRSGLVFGWYARIRGLPGRLHPGRFVLDRGMGGAEVVAVLEGPSQPAPRTVTIPDGLTTREVADRLQAAGLVSAASYRAAVARGRYAGVPPLPGAPPGSGWEGLCLGDTFQLPAGASARQVVALQLQDFDRHLRRAVLTGAAAVGLTPYQVVVLASIVGAEAPSAHDRQRVAGVFLNRLRRGMPLQSDVTVLYALARAGLRPARPLQTSIASPYNTYVHRGLPPGPIANPGVSAVEAVLHPIRSADLFFVALPDGRVLYAATLQLHQRQVQQAGLG